MIGKLEKQNNKIGIKLNLAELAYYNIHTEYVQITIYTINRIEVKGIGDLSRIDKDFLELRTDLVKGLNLKVGDVLKFRLENIEKIKE